VSLLVKEYELRHRYADKPDLEGYRYRFPGQFEKLARRLSRGPSFRPPPAPPRDGTIGFEPDPALHTPSDDAQPTHSPEARPNPGAKPAARKTVHDSRPASPPRPPAPLPPTGPKGGSGSAVPLDILPADANYRLIRRLGRGAFGEVYEAEALGGVRVAVKRIFLNATHPASRNEIEALESLKLLHHIHLTQIHAFWLSDDRLVVVMDLADGTLHDRVEFHRKRGLPGVPPDELVPFTEEAAEALDYLHSQKMTHRDVKPKNLLHLGGHAKVADFGLARVHSGFDETIVPYKVGTPAYMAPEVQTGKFDFTSDQYSLAATYVHARLGRPPFSGDSLPELEKLHRTATPDLGNLPAAEQAVLLKALAKNPKDRYPSCVAFAKALRTAVLEPPPKADAGPGFWAGVFRAVAPAAASALAVVLVLVVLRGDNRGQPTDTGKKEEQAGRKETDPPTPWCPAGWQPDGKDTRETVDGREYYKKLTREVRGLGGDGDEKLVALLVAPTQANHPPPFYMLENKITNRVFRAVWERTETRPDSPIKAFRDSRQKATWEKLLPGEWRNGADDHKAKRLGTDGPRVGCPVAAVTVPEAFFVAQELGGLLPTYRQWRKAIGAMGDEKTRPGPAGKKEEGKDDNERRKSFEDRKLAIGLLDGPRDVHAGTDDRSYCGIHQLVSNGPEWLRDRRGDGPIVDLDEPNPFNTYVALVGYDIKIPRIITFADLQGTEGPVNYVSWMDTAQYAGFRVVLEPR
jgi:hypothetical protein